MFHLRDKSQRGAEHVNGSAAPELHGWARRAWSAQQQRGARLLGGGFVLEGGRVAIRGTVVVVVGGVFRCLGWKISCKDNLWLYERE